MAEATPLFVCRASDVARLRAYFETASGGAARTVVLQAPLGGGKRAAVGELVRSLPANDDVLVLRAAWSDEEDGLRALLGLYASLFGVLYRNPTLRGKVELLLNAQLPQHSKRVQQWFQAFNEGLKKSAPSENDKSFQLTLPRDNPLIGFVEILCGIARKLPVILEIQNVHNSQSVASFTLLEALLNASKDCKLLTVLETETIDGNDAANAWMAPTWLDLYKRRHAEFEHMTLEPWTGEEVAAYLASRGLEGGDPARLAEIAKGRPAYVAELVDYLSEAGRLGEDLSGQTLGSLAPCGVDEDELEEAEGGGDGQRKHATAEDANRVHYLAALLGLSFPSGLVADLGGFERDSVDDLLDASGDLVAEMQFSKPLGTWVYQFKKAIWRQGVIDSHSTEEDREIGRRVGLFIERFLVPRGYEFLMKAVRLYAEFGATDRAMNLRNAAAGFDRPDIWAMVQDLIKYYEKLSWPDPLRRNVYIQLLERLVQNGEVEATERLVQEALAWAREKGDTWMEGQVLFAGSRLDFRRQDLYRGRDRAKDALKVFTGLDDKLKVAEIQNHLALIEYTDGNPNAAMDHLRKALESANVPAVQANVEFIRGLIARRSRKLPDAVEHFKKANEIAGGIGMAPLALESGFHYGESLFMSQQLTRAADVLQRVAQIAQALQNPVRERSAVALLAQAQGMQRHYEAALQMAQRTLQLTQELKFEKLLPLDIYNVGYFTLQLGRATEAVSLFSKAKERSAGQDPTFIRELHFHYGLALVKVGEKSQGANLLKDAVKIARDTKDWKKAMQGLEELASIEVERGDKALASRLLQEAIKAADEGGLKEERKSIRRKLDELQG